MKKMFLKKLICLILSLSFTLSPVLLTLVTFSSNSCEYFWGISPFDLDELEKRGEDALAVSRGIVGGDSSEFEVNAESSLFDESYETNIFCFKAFWNYLVKKYVFLLAAPIHKQEIFEASSLYLNEQDTIPDEIIPILHNLATQLKICNQLCDTCDLPQVDGVLQLLGNSYESKEVDRNLVTIKKSSGEPVVSFRKFVNEKNVFINLSVANSIYREIYKKILKYINVSGEIIEISLQVKNKAGCWVWQELNFNDIWVSVINCFVLEKLDPPIYIIDDVVDYAEEKNPLLLIDLTHLSIVYVQILHEFATKLKMCGCLYPVEYLPYLDAAIGLCEKIASDYEFDLPDDAIMLELKNTNWEENKPVLDEIKEILDFNQSTGYPAKRPRYF